MKSCFETTCKRYVNWTEYLFAPHVLRTGHTSLSRAHLYTSPHTICPCINNIYISVWMRFIGSAPPQYQYSNDFDDHETLTMSTARLLWCAQWMVVVLCAEPVIWQPSARQPPCPFSRSKSQYAAVGSTPNEKCRRATVTGCTGLPGLHPSTQESNTLRQVIPHMESP